VAIFELYSRRQKKLRGEMPDVYRYDEFSNSFRVQVVHIWTDTIGRDEPWHEGGVYAYTFIHNTLCREHGLFELGHGGRRLEQIANYFLQCDDPEKVVDIIQVSFHTIDTIVRPNWVMRFRGIVLSDPDEAISDLNRRFKEHGIGFQFESGQLIRMDSDIIHQEIVRPVLLLLREKMYAGANDEFLRAHEHYRSGRYKECLNECLKAFESAMKAICKKRRWPFSQNDTAKKLLDICLAHELIPAFWQSHFTGIRSTLESGIPTVRNRTSGHGQGSEPTTVPAAVASYALHLTATTLLFLSEAEKNLGK
jgi:hypothetical protein